MCRLPLRDQVKPTDLTACRDDGHTCASSSASKNRRCLQVSTAASWQSARQADMRAHNAVTLDYDWCGATCSPAFLAVTSAVERPTTPQLEHSEASKDLMGIAGRVAPAVEIRQHSIAFSSVGLSVPCMSICRTYTTPYMGDLHICAPLADGNHVTFHDSNGLSAAGASHSPPQTSAEMTSGAAEHSQVVSRDAHSRPHAEAGVRWQRSEQQIDRSALMTRDPILFYDDVPLHVSELDDNGLSQLTVKASIEPPRQRLALVGTRRLHLARTCVLSWAHGLQPYDRSTCGAFCGLARPRPTFLPPPLLTFTSSAGMAGRSTTIDCTRGVPLPINPATAIAARAQLRKAKR